MREAERREQAAIDYAKKVQEENKNLQSVMSSATSAKELLLMSKAYNQLNSF